MSQPAFKDHFSARAEGYAAFRPHYPDELFAWLADLVPEHGLAWDAGTGSGQAAAGLAAHFASVLATDASEAQIARAEPAARVRFAVGRESGSGLAAGSCDMVTAAQALHWFDVAAFFAEARRVLRPGGVCAVWTYGAPSLDEPAANALLQTYVELLDPFWPPERRIAEAGYRDLPFPFDEIGAPRFTLKRDVGPRDLAGYLRTTSAHQAYMQKHEVDPVEWLEERLDSVWPDTLRHRLSWPLAVRAGRAGDSFPA